MVQKMYSSAHHTTSTQEFRFFALLILFLFILSGFVPLTAQDITGLEMVRSIQHPGNYSVATMDSYFDSTHQLIAYSIGDGTGHHDTLVLYDFNQDLILGTIPGNGGLFAIRFMDERQLLYVTRDTLWKVTGIGESISREFLKSGIRYMSIAHDLSMLGLLMYHNGTSYVGTADFDTATGTIQDIDTLGTGDFNIDEYTWMAFSPGDEYIAFNGGYNRPYVNLIDVQAGSLMQVLTPDIESTYSPQFFFQKGKLKLIVGGGFFNGAVAVIDVATRTQEGSLSVFPHYNYSIVFDTTGLYMVCGGYDGIIKIFSVADTLFTEIESYDLGTVKILHMTTDNQYLLTGYQASAGARLDIQRIIREPSVVRTLISMPLILNPNPATGRIYMVGIRDALVMVYDRTGQWVWSARETGDGIDVGHLPSGMYIIIAEDGHVMRIGRFVKE